MTRRGGSISIVVSGWGSLGRRTPRGGPRAGGTRSSPRARPPVRGQAEGKATGRLGQVWEGLQARSELGIALEDLSEARMVRTRETIPGTRQQSLFQNQ